MLSNMEKNDIQFNVFLGFDGFVDRILKPIRTKTNTRIVPFQTMQEFSSYIGDKSGKSCSIDLETMEEKIGGNMPIAANALGNLGCQAICIGALGYPEINPIFKQMSSNCKLMSVSDPGYCDSLEFEDGKLMLASNTSIDRLNYEQITSVIGEDDLVKYINQCDAAAFFNWGEMLHSNDIWQKFLDHIIPKCTFSKKKIMMIDFSDFSKRENSEVKKMVELVNRYAEYFDITISLNENELDLFSDKLGFSETGAPLEEKIKAVSGKINCRNFVVHLLEASCYIEDNQIYTVRKEVINNPKIITGGGDNFNAGLLYGLLLELDISQAIKVGSGLSCLYVKDGQNVSLSKLKQYVADYNENWKKGM